MEYEQKILNLEMFLPELHTLREERALWREERLRLHADLNKTKAEQTDAKNELKEQDEHMAELSKLHESYIEAEPRRVTEFHPRIVFADSPKNLGQELVFSDTSAILDQSISRIQPEHPRKSQPLHRLREEPIDGLPGSRDVMQDVFLFIIWD